MLKEHEMVRRLGVEPSKPAFVARAARPARDRLFGGEIVESNAMPEDTIRFQGGPGPSPVNSPILEGLQGVAPRSQRSERSVLLLDERPVSLFWDDDVVDAPSPLVRVHFPFGEVRLQLVQGGDQDPASG